MIEVQINHNDHSIKSASQLVDVLKVLPDLRLEVSIKYQKLDVSFLKKFKEEISKQAHVSKKLTRLSLIGNELGDAGAIQFAELIKNCPQLVDITLVNNNVKNRGAIALIKEISRRSYFEKLNLDSNLIEDLGIREIADCIKTHKNLHSLSLSDNSYSEKGFELLAQSLQENDSLRILKISKSPCTNSAFRILAKAIGNHPSLVQLVLRNIKNSKEINKISWELLAKKIKESQTLKMLDVSSNLAGNVMAIFSDPDLGLISLSLAGVGLDNKGAIRLSEYLAKNQTLEKLNLKENNFNNEGAQRLIESLKTNSALTELNCNTCKKVSGTKQFKLEQVAKSRLAFEQLNLSDTSLKPDASVTNNANPEKYASQSDLESSLPEISTVDKSNTGTSTNYSHASSFYRVELINFKFNQTTVILVRGDYPIKPFLFIEDSVGKRIIPNEFCMQYIKNNILSQSKKELKSKFIQAQENHQEQAGSQQGADYPSLKTSLLPQLSEDVPYVHLVVDLENTWFLENNRLNVITQVASSKSQVAAELMKEYNNILNDTALPLLLEGCQVSGFNQKQQRIIGSNYNGRIDKDSSRYQFHKENINANTAKIIKTGRDTFKIGFCTATELDKNIIRFAISEANIQCNGNVLEYKANSSDCHKSYSKEVNKKSDLLKYNPHEEFTLEQGNVAELKQVFKKLKPHNINSFLGGNITIERLKHPLIVYRTGDVGKYWCNDLPKSPWQNSLDLAMHPKIYPSSMKQSSNWHPANKGVLMYEIPAGEIIIRGKAAPQYDFCGGSEQFIVNNINNSEIRKSTWDNWLKFKNPSAFMPDAAPHTVRRITYYPENTQANKAFQTVVPRLFRTRSAAVHDVLNLASYASEQGFIQNHAFDLSAIEQDASAVTYYNKDGSKSLFFQTRDPIRLHADIVHEFTHGTLPAARPGSVGQNWHGEFLSRMRPAVIQDYREFARNRHDLAPIERKVADWIFHKPHHYPMGERAAERLAFTIQGMADADQAVRNVAPRLYSLVTDYTAMNARMPVLYGQAADITLLSSRSTSPSYRFLETSIAPNLRVTYGVQVQDPRQWNFRSAFSEPRRVAWYKVPNYGAIGRNLRDGTVKIWSAAKPYVNVGFNAAVVGFDIYDEYQVRKEWDPNAFSSSLIFGGETGLLNLGYYAGVGAALGPAAIPYFAVTAISELGVDHAEAMHQHACNNIDILMRQLKARGASNNEIRQQLREELALNPYASGQMAFAISLGKFFKKINFVPRLLQKHREEIRSQDPMFQHHQKELKKLAMQNMSAQMDELFTQTFEKPLLRNHALPTPEFLPKPKKQLSLATEFSSIRTENESHNAWLFSGDGGNTGDSLPHFSSASTTGHSQYTKDVASTNLLFKRNNTSTSPLPVTGSRIVLNKESQPGIVKPPSAPVSSTATNPKLKKPEPTLIPETEEGIQNGGKTKETDPSTVFAEGIDSFLARDHSSNLEPSDALFAGVPDKLPKPENPVMDPNFVANGFSITQSGDSLSINVDRNSQFFQLAGFEQLTGLLRQAEVIQQSGGEIVQASQEHAAEKPKVEVAADNIPVLAKSDSLPLDTRVSIDKQKIPLMSNPKLVIEGDKIGASLDIFDKGTICIAGGPTGVVIKVTAAFGKGFWTALGAGVGVGAAIAAVALTARFVYKKHLQRIQARVKDRFENTLKDKTLIDNTIDALNKELDSTQDFDLQTKIDSINKFIKHIEGRVAKENNRIHDDQAAKYNDAAKQHTKVATGYSTAIQDLKGLVSDLKYAQVKSEFIIANSNKNAVQLAEMATSITSQTKLDKNDVAKMDALRDLIVGKVQQLAASGNLSEARKLLQATYGLSYFLPGDIGSFHFGGGLGKVDKNTQGDIDKVNAAIGEINRIISAGGNVAAAIDGLLKHIEIDENIIGHWKDRKKKHSDISKKDKKYVSKDQWSARIRALESFIQALKEIKEQYKNGCQKATLKLESLLSVVVKYESYKGKTTSFWLEELKAAKENTDPEQKDEVSIIHGYATSNVVGEILNNIGMGQFDISEAILSKYKEFSPGDAEFSKALENTLELVRNNFEAGNDYWLGHIKTNNAIDEDKRTIEQNFITQIASGIVLSDIISKVYNGKFEEAGKDIAKFKAVAPEEQHLVIAYEEAANYYKGHENEEADYWLNEIKQNLPVIQQEFDDNASEEEKITQAQAQQKASVKINIATTKVKKEVFIKTAKGEFDDAKSELTKLKQVNPENEQGINKLIKIIEDTTCDLEVHKASLEQSTMFLERQIASNKRIEAYKKQQQQAHKDKLKEIEQAGLPKENNPNQGSEDQDLADSIDLGNEIDNSAIGEDYEGAPLPPQGEGDNAEVSFDEMAMENSAAIAAQDKIIQKLQKLGFNGEAAIALQNEVNEMNDLSSKERDKLNNKIKDLWFIHTGQIANGIVAPCQEMLERFLRGCEPSTQRYVFQAFISATLKAPQILAPNWGVLLGQGAFAYAGYGDWDTFVRNKEEIKEQINNDMSLGFSRKEGKLIFDREKLSFNGVMLWSQLGTSALNTLALADDFITDRVDTDAGFARFDKYKHARNTVVQYAGYGTQIGMAGHSLYKLVPEIKNWAMKGARFSAAAPQLAATLVQGALTLGTWKYEKDKAAQGRAIVDSKYYKKKILASSSISGLSTTLFVASLFAGPWGWGAYMCVAAAATAHTANAVHSVSSKSGEMDIAAQTLAAAMSNIYFWSQKEGELAAALSNVERLSIENHNLKELIEKFKNKQQTESTNARIETLEKQLAENKQKIEDGIAKIESIEHCQEFGIIKNELFEVLIEADKLQQSLQVATEKVLREDLLTEKDEQKLKILVDEKEQLEQSVIQQQKVVEDKSRALQTISDAIEREMDVYKKEIDNYLDKIYDIVCKSHLTILKGLAYQTSQHEAINAARILHLFHQVKKAYEPNNKEIMALAKLQDSPLDQDKKKYELIVQEQSSLRTTKTLEMTEEFKENDQSLVGSQHKIPTHLAWQIILAYRFTALVESDAHLPQFREQYNEYINLIRSSAKKYWWYENKENISKGVKGIVEFALKRYVELANERTEKDEKIKLLQLVRENYDLCLTEWHKLLGDQHLYYAASIYHKIGSKEDVKLMLSYIDKEAFMERRKSPEISGKIIDMLRYCDEAQGRKLLLANDRKAFGIDDEYIGKYLESLKKENNFDQILNYINCVESNSNIESRDFASKNYYKAYATFYKSNLVNLLDALKYLIQEPMLRQFTITSRTINGLMHAANPAALQCWLLMYDLLKHCLESIKHAPRLGARVQAASQFYSMLIVCIENLNKFNLSASMKNFYEVLLKDKKEAVNAVKFYLSLEHQAKSQKGEKLLSNSDLMQKVSEHVSLMHACIRGELEIDGKSLDLASAVEHNFTLLSYKHHKKGVDYHKIPIVVTKDNQSLFKALNIKLETIKKHVIEPGLIATHILGIVSEQSDSIVDMILASINIVEGKDEIIHVDKQISQNDKIKKENVDRVLEYLVKLSEGKVKVGYKSSGFDIIDALALIIKKNIVIYRCDSNPKEKVKTDSKDEEGLLKIKKATLKNPTYETIELLHTNFNGYTNQEQYCNYFVRLLPAADTIQEIVLTDEAVSLPPTVKKPTLITDIEEDVEFQKNKDSLSSIKTKARSFRYAANEEKLSKINAASVVGASAADTKSTPLQFSEISSSSNSDESIVTKGTTPNSFSGSKLPETANSKQATNVLFSFKAQKPANQAIDFSPEIENDKDKVKQRLDMFMNNLPSWYAQAMRAHEGIANCSPVWGGEPEIKLIAKSMQVQITVYEQGKKVPTVFNPNKNLDNIDILYYGSGHYVLFDGKVERKPGVYKGSEGRNAGDCLFDACIRAKKRALKSNRLQKNPNTSSHQEIAALRENVAKLFLEDAECIDNVKALYTAFIFADQAVYNEMLNDNTLARGPAFAEAILLHQLVKKNLDYFEDKFEDAALRYFFKQHRFDSKNINKIVQVSVDEAEAIIHAKKRDVTVAKFQQEEGDGFTALTYVVHRGYYTLAEALIRKCNANINQRDRHGKRAIDYALAFKNEQEGSARGLLYRLLCSSTQRSQVATITDITPDW